MKTWGAMGAGLRAAWVAGGAAALTVAGAALWTVINPAAPDVPVEVAANVASAPESTATEAPSAKAPATETPTETPAETAVVAEPAPAATTEAATAETAAETPVADAPALSNPPGVDFVRVEPDGSAVVAGTADPDALVSLRVDGAEVVAAQADASGKFVALFTLAPSQAPRLLSLLMQMPDGTEVAGSATVALAPTEAPVVVASEPATPTEPAATETATLEPAAKSAAPAALLLTDEGATVLQSGADVPAEVAANVGIDTIAYTPEGHLQLGGHGQAENYVRLYLDNAEVATTPVTAQGTWLVTLEAIAPGIYTLRADQVDAGGTVTSRFETPFKRETLEALAAASTVAAPEPAAELASEPVAEPATNPVVDAIAEPSIEIAAAQTAPAEPAAEAAPAVPAEPATEVAAAEPATAPAVEAVPVEPAAEPVADASPAQPAADASVAVAAAEPVAEPAAAEASALVAAAPISVTVQPGFTLWAIAKQNFGAGVMYVEVWEANKDKIRNPDLIYPGQVFTIPVSE